MEIMKKKIILIIVGALILGLGILILTGAGAALLGLAVYFMVKRKR